MCRPPKRQIRYIAGDDCSDETMFELNTPELLSIKVGDGPTQARFRVADPARLRQFLP